MTKAVWKNMAFGTVNAYVVLVHNKYPPTDEEFSEWIQSQLARGVEHGLVTRYLIVTEGGIPTSEQLKAFHHASSPIIQKNPNVMRSAIVGPSTFMRGIVSAMRLINPVFRAFSPDDMSGAYAYLGIPPAYFGEIEALIAALKVQLRR